MAVVEVARPTGTGVGEAVPAVEARAISHAYRGRAGRVLAVDRADLEVAPGELVALLGPSGCGKTTLLRIVAGLLTPTSGEVRLAGESPAAARRRRAIGWMAQDDGLFPWRTVAENVALPLEVGGRRADPLVVAEALGQVGLSDAATRYPHELSGGMRQRTALARALVAEPAILLLDEPFAHLDEVTRDQLGSLLLAVRGGRTIVLVTHSVAEAVHLADRVVVFSSRPSRVLLSLRLDLARPRREDQDGFGMTVRRLKLLLGEGR